MKNCKSITALVLAVALCFSSFVGISTADITASAAEAQAFENLIQNGDFENISKVTESGNNNYAAFGAWETGFAYGADVNKDEHHSGSQSLKLLYERSYSFNFYVYQQISVEKNTAYKLTFWYKSNETLACEVVTKHGFTYPYAESDIILAHTVVGTINDSAPKWREVTLNFNSGNNETLYVQFDANALANTVKDGTHYVYIDDISVVKNIADESTDEPKLISDGDFENISKNIVSDVAELGAWKTAFIYGADVNKDEHHSGSQSLKLLYERSYSFNFYVYQQISVEKNTAYKLTFWYKSNETLACEVVTKHGFTYPYAESDIILAHTVVGTINDSAPKWREVTLNFNSGNNETLYVQFDANALANTVKDGTHYAYLDNVSLVKMVPHESAKVVSYGGRNNVLKMATYKSNNDSSAVKQTVIVKKNTTYCLTYEVYTGGANWVNNKPSVIYAEVIGGASTLSKQSFQATSSTQGKWTKTTLIFDSGENETVEIRFDLLNSGDYNDEQGTGFASFYIDDVGIYEKITGDVYVDGGTDSKDLVFLKKILLGVYSDQTNANVNNDEGIDIRDLVALKKLLCGLKAEN